MMKRVLEPEIMDGPEQVLAYAESDFEEENQGFVDHFFTLYPNLENPHIVDVGCGPGDIPIRVVRRHETCRVTGIDASQPMIAYAEQAVHKAGFQDRVQLLCQRFQDVTLTPPADAVISNSLVHHLPNPLRFWFCLKTLVKPSGHVLVMDLLRPESPEAAQAIVDEQAGDEPEQLRNDFYHSLLAAFTEDEVAAHLAELNLSRLFVDVLDDRHWVVYGQVF